MKPVIFWIAMAALGYYAYHWQSDLDKNQQQAASAQQMAAKAQADLAACAEREKNALDQVLKLQNQIAETQAAVAKEKELVAQENARKAMMAASPPPPPVVAAPKPVVPTASPEQIANRKSDIGQNYAFLILRDGTLLKNVTIDKIAYGQISFTSPVTGNVTLGQDKLPTELVTRFGLNFDQPAPPPAPVVVADSGAKAPAMQNPGRTQEVIVPGSATPFGFQTQTVPAQPTSTTTTTTVVTDVKENN